MLQLYTLGVLDLRWQDDSPLPLPPTLKSQALFIYLATQPDRHTRAQLCGMFWGDHPERKARRSLSTALWHIRRCLPQQHSYFSTDGDTVQFNGAAPFWLDVAAFTAHAAGDEVADLQAAIHLYRGCFLDGFYDEWVVTERYRLETVYLDTLAKLMAAYEAAGLVSDALATATRLLESDPLREDAHRIAMRAYYQLGQRAAALQQYEQYRALLQDELGVEPMAETRRLRQTILEERFQPSQGRPPVAPQAPIQTRGRGIDPRDAVRRIPLVSRDKELADLDDAWQQALANMCSFLLVSGDAGVGKTRLVEAFAQQMRWRAVCVARGRCYEFERLLPYQPIVEALRNLPTELVASVSAELPVWMRRHVARLLPGPDAPASAPADVEQLRLFDSVTRFLARLAAREPLLLVFEDLHWAAESTLHLLHHLVRRLVEHPLLIIGTARTEAVDPADPLATLVRRLDRERYVRRLALEPLSLPGVTFLLQQISGCEDEIEPLAQRLFRDTGGNPYFLVEILKALFEQDAIQFESGVWQADFTALSRTDMPLPDTIEEAIQARFGRMTSPAQSLVQVAAVSGKTFSFELLSHASEQSPAAMLASIDDLLRQRFIEEGDEGDDYAFTHHLVRETIYRALPRHRRLHLHGQVGTALEQLAGDKRDGVAGALAFHFEQACILDPDLAAKAVAYLQQAGHRAVHKSANREAIAYYRRGLNLLERLPDAVRQRKNVELHVDLTVPTAIVYGYAAPESGRAYRKAYAVSRDAGKLTALFRSLLGLGRYYGLSGAVDKGVEIAHQLLVIAQEEQDDGLLLQAYRELGGTLFASGVLDQARTQFECGMALYEPTDRDKHAYRFGHDPAVTLYGYLSIIRWLQGFADEALDYDAALARLVPDMTHPASRVYALCIQAMFAGMRLDVAQAIDLAPRAVALGRSLELPNWTALALALHGRALCLRGNAAEGLTLLRDGTTRWRETGAEFFSTPLLCWQAEAHLAEQQLDAGVAALTSALEIAQRSGSQFWLAEIERLQGELLWATSEDVEAVKACFQRAAATAAEQGARTLGLRATTSAARLMQQQGRLQEASAMLAEPRNWFDGKGVCPDLVSAESLLRALNQAAEPI